MDDTQRHQAQGKHRLAHVQDQANKASGGANKKGKALRKTMIWVSSQTCMEWWFGRWRNQVDVFCKYFNFGMMIRLLESLSKWVSNKLLHCWYRIPPSGVNQNGQFLGFCSHPNLSSGDSLSSHRLHGVASRFCPPEIARHQSRCYVLFLVDTIHMEGDWW